MSGSFLEALSYPQLITVTAVCSVLSVLPFSLIIPHLLRSYLKTRSLLSRRLFTVSILLIPVACDSFIAGVQELQCYVNQQSRHPPPSWSPPLLDGQIAACAYTQLWRTNLTWGFESLACAYFVWVSVDRHGCLHEHGLIWFPLRLRNTLKVVLVILFTALMVLLSCPQLLDPSLQSLVAVPLFGFCGLIDISLCIATFYVTYQVRVKLLEVRADSELFGDAHFGLSDISKTTATTTHDLQMLTEPPKSNLAASSSTQLQPAMPAARSVSEHKTNPKRLQVRRVRRRMLQRVTILMFIAGFDICMFVIYGMVMLLNEPLFTLPWVIAVGQLPTIFVRIYFMLSVYYLRSLASLAEDGSRMIGGRGITSSAGITEFFYPFFAFRLQLGARENEMANKSSQRLREVEATRTLDEPTRRRQQQRHLDALESDNYAVSSDALEGIVLGRRDTVEEMALDNADGGIDGSGAAGRPRKKPRKRELKRLIAARRPFLSLVEESRIDALPPGVPSYLTAAAGPSLLPARRFCSVCGFEARHRCLRCGMQHCSLRCKLTHDDTRCMKFTV
ncbi:Zinc finger HIT domain-containing protein 1 [Sorochytrium milnesiophthora]